MTSSESQHHPVSALSNMTSDVQPTPSQNYEYHSAREGEQIVNPFEVTAADEYGIDYDKLVKTFGTRKINQELLDRFERLTGRKAHRYLRRGHFFSERLLRTV